MIYLSGGGNHVSPIDYKFAEILDRSKTLVYIPNALTDIAYTKALEWFKSIFVPLGIKNIEMWDNLSPRTALQEVAGIYLGGGKTAHLLNQIKTSGFDNVLLEAFKKDVPMYGGSAGAIILGKDIRTAPGALDLPETDSLGLNLYKGYSATCHYSTASETRIKIASRKINSAVLCIPEDCGIICSKELIPVGRMTVQVIFPNGSIKEIKK